MPPELCPPANVAPPGPGLTGWGALGFTGVSAGKGDSAGLGSDLHEAGKNVRNKNTARRQKDPPKSRNRFSLPEDLWIKLTLRI